MSSPFAPIPGSETTDAANPATARRDYYTEWLTSFPNPANSRQAADKLKQAEDYARAIYLAFCNRGTCPPMDALMPDLVAKVGEVKKAREGLEAFAEKDPNGLILWGSAIPTTGKYYDKFLELGTAVFREVKRISDEHEPVESMASAASQVARGLIPDSSWGFWKTGIAIGLGIAGVMSVTTLIKTVKGEPE